MGVECIALVRAWNVMVTVSQSEIVCSEQCSPRIRSISLEFHKLMDKHKFRFVYTQKKIPFPMETKWKSAAFTSKGEKCGQQHRAIGDKLKKGTKSPNHNRNVHSLLLLNSSHYAQIMNRNRMCEMAGNKNSTSDEKKTPHTFWNEEKKQNKPKRISYQIFFVSCSSLNTFPFVLSFDNQVKYMFREVKIKSSHHFFVRTKKGEFFSTIFSFFIVMSRAHLGLCFVLCWRFVWLYRPLFYSFFFGFVQVTHKFIDRAATAKLNSICVCVCACEVYLFLFSFCVPKPKKESQKNILHRK